jgi:hypothetical protein
MTGRSGRDLRAMAGSASSVAQLTALVRPLTGLTPERMLLFGDFDFSEIRRGTQTIWIEGGAIGESLLGAGIVCVTGCFCGMCECLLVRVPARAMPA